MNAGAQLDALRQGPDALETLVQLRIDLVTYKITIDDLPNEVLVDIFLSASANSHIVPIILSHVSGRWREVSLDTSNIWTKIVLGCVSKGNAGGGRSIPVLRAGQKSFERACAFLERSKNVLLDFAVDMATIEIFVAITGLVAQHSHRARSLTGKCSWHSFPIALRPAMWPHLSSLNLTDGITESSNDRLSLNNHNGTADIVLPALCHLTLTRLSLATLSAPIMSTFRSFTWLGHDESISKLFLYLQHAPLLEELFFLDPKFQAASRSSTSDQSPIILTHLVSLDWYFTSQDNVEIFFSVVQAPNLINMHISLNSHRENLNYLPKALPNLRFLNLSIPDESTSVSCFGAFEIPKLTSIEITVVKYPYFPLVYRFLHHTFRFSRSRDPT